MKDKSRNVLNFILALACLAIAVDLFFNTAAAASLRCSSGLVRPGQSAIQLEQKCGQPISVEYVISGKGSNVQPGRIHFYDMDNGSIYGVEVASGIVQRIIRVRR